MNKIRNKCRYYNIETIGLYVGWGTSSLKDYVDKFVQKRDFAGLPMEVLKVLKGLVDQGISSEGV